MTSAMSRTRNYKPETLEIVERFFVALEALINDGTLRGIQTYCTRHGIDKRHLYAQRNDHGRGYFEVAWILPMIADYNVSSAWLLFGKGPMLRK